MPIRVLPASVAATIAAGEVIERPASIVKELVENAIDAGAHTLRVEVERGGLDLIRVSDDGCGIDGDEMEIACRRHATSKLTATADLASLSTLGFRGEALPSIIAAADVQIASRTDIAKPGTTLHWRDGSLLERTPYSGARGTTITARNIFARQPARLKFLRSTASEAGQVTAVVQPYALAYPEVRFSLSIDGRQTLQTSGSGDLRDAAGRALSAETALALLEIEPDGTQHESGIAVTGLVSPPSLSRGTRSGITVFINRRWVQPRRLSVAVEQGYETLLMVGRHPIALVEVSLPPADVDVNVHPAKADVRFRDERAVFGAVLAAVRHTLVGQAPVPAFDLAGGRLESRFAGAMSEAAAIAAATAAPILQFSSQPTQPPLWQSLLRPEEHERGPNGVPAEPERPRIPLLRVVGQTSGTYIVAEGPTGMYLIDQHAAHERVLYEQIRAQERGTAPVQGLLAPVSVELGVQQLGALTVYREQLAEQGFDVEPFGERTVLLRAVPAVLRAAEPGKALLELLDALADEREEPGLDRLHKTLACHGSVRAGKILALDEMRELIRSLEDCEAPRTCPHGRPTMVHLSAASLEREFRRR